MQSPSFFAPSHRSAICIPEAMFLFPGVRFSLLTSSMLRIEYSPEDIFEDRPSQVFWHRRQPPPAFHGKRDKKSLKLETEFFEFTYRDGPGETSAENLKIQVKGSDEFFTADTYNKGQLPGTTRTLDEVDGPVTLEPGLISRSGWVILDDTSSLVFNAGGWLEPRGSQPGYRDLYLLVYGRDYKLALRDYQRISGKPSLIPRAMLGNWWSRFWEYSQEDIQQLVKRFQQEQIPLSAFIIDMDWHITDTGNACSGWTGFSWNRQLFPDPPGLLYWLHKHNLITSLNLHPAEGIYPHEERYPQAARALGVDPESQEAIAFDIADPQFARVYFDQLLHPLEEQGVDFWWLDWQQGDDAGIPGLDPLWWLNHLHFYDLALDRRKRPVIFSRWGGAGNHRYPIGFSGDTVVSWKSLAFQPFFTAAAANSAFGWWSHDIGGHMYGQEDPELYLRWVQFGVLSPIFRLHCTKHPFMHREPWAYDAEILRLTREAMQFRHALVPYLYTMARRNQVQGIPPVTPLYYDWPEQDSAYLAANQYLLGSQLMAAPVIEPLDDALNLSRAGTWFPPGHWFSFFNGERIPGPQWKIQYFSLSDIPLFARAGAIIPLQSETTQNGCHNPGSIDLVVFPGEDGEFDLYEDDGVSQDYMKTGGCITAFRSKWTGNTLSLTVLPASGQTSLIPERRSYRILFRGVTEPDGFNASLDGKSIRLLSSYDHHKATMSLGPVEMTADQRLEVEIFSEDLPLLIPCPSPEEAVMRLLEYSSMETITKGKISQCIEELESDISLISSADLVLSISHLLALIEMVTGAGAVRIEHPSEGSHLVLINPRELPGFKCGKKEVLRIRPGGAIVPDSSMTAEVDYFGLISMLL